MVCTFLHWSPSKTAGIGLAMRFGVEDHLQQFAHLAFAKRWYFGEFFLGQVVGAVGIVDFHRMGDDEIEFWHNHNVLSQVPDRGVAALRHLDTREQIAVLRYPPQVSVPRAPAARVGVRGCALLDPAGRDHLTSLPLALAQ